MADLDVQSWEYLEKLQGTEFYRLYRNPPSAMAIFRKRLSSLAKSLVMTMLYLNAPLPARDLDIWIRPGSKSEKEHAVDLLQRYHIAALNPSRAYTLTGNFARSLRQALTGAGDSRSFGEVAFPPSNPSVTIADLDTYARNQWEGILGYMVGNSAVTLESNTTMVEPSPAVIELLEAGRLIEFASATRLSHQAKITKDGFAFVLQDINTQVWSLLFLYVDHAEDLAMTKVSVLAFIFLLSSLELGQAYTKPHLDADQLRILSNLSDFGIIYQASPESPDFFPTRLATMLTSDASTSSSTSISSLATPLSNNAESTGFIIIETNYRIYAYTSSALQTSLLGLFTTLRSRHPNLVTAKMTKSSIQRAVSLGITASQIISYLSSHAHPQMRRNAALAASTSASSHAQIKSGNQNNSSSSTTTITATTTIAPVIPATVLDQIHLWQIEKDRMTTTPGYLMKDFATQAEYDRYVSFADQIGVLIWRSDRRRIFFVNQIESLRRFMKSTRESGSGGGDGGT